MIVIECPNISYLLVQLRRNNACEYGLPFREALHAEAKGIESAKE